VLDAAFLKDRKQRVSKKQNVKTDSAANIGGQGKLTYFMYFPWPPMGAVLSNLILAFF
jgi:hypothetical protein